MPFWYKNRSGATPHSRTAALAALLNSCSTQVGSASVPKCTSRDECISSTCNKFVRPCCTEGRQSCNALENSSKCLVQYHIQAIKACQQCVELASTLVQHGNCSSWVPSDTVYFSCNVRVSLCLTSSRHHRGKNAWVGRIDKPSSQQSKHGLAG